jgi:hemoglobin
MEATKRSASAMEAFISRMGEAVLASTERSSFLREPMARALRLVYDEVAGFVLGMGETMRMSDGDLPDIESRGDIKVIVDAFYERVRGDDLLGFIFNDVAGVDWEKHLPKMYDFWETMVLRAGSYSGNPLLPHLRLSGKTEMGAAQFERWKLLFFETVDEHFAGDRSGHMKRAAADMAQVMDSRINGTTIPFANPELATGEAGKAAE